MDLAHRIACILLILFFFFFIDECIAIMKGEVYQTLYYSADEAEMELRDQYKKYNFPVFQYVK